MLLALALLLTLPPPDIRLHRVDLPRLADRGTSGHRTLDADKRAACAVTHDERVVCWHENRWPRHVRTRIRSPRVLMYAPRLAHVRTISVRATQGCALARSGEVSCWRFSPIPPWEPWLSEVIATPIVGARAIAAGGAFNALATSDGALQAWSPRQVVPVPISIVSRAVEVVAGDEHFCARRADGRVQCVWPLGFEDVYLWQGIEQLQPVFAARSLHAFRPIDRTDDLCTLDEADARAEPKLQGVVDLDALGSHTCAVLSTGRVACWGPKGPALWGWGEGAACRPFFVPEIVDATYVEVGGRHACALRRSGRVTCWGANDAGQLGFAPAANLDHDLPAAPPRDVPDLASAVELAAGDDFTCARLDDGRVFCWGAEYEPEVPELEAPPSSAIPPD